MFKKIFLLIITLGVFASCELDVPPVNILTDEDLYNEGGMTAYLGSLYSRLPMEDYNFSSATDGKQGFFWWNTISSEMICTGETVNRNNTGSIDALHPNKNYWGEGYKIIRNANDLLLNLPNYVGKLTGAEAWIAEAKFLRAYVYFALVKRYGGVPILDHPQGLTDSTYNVPRNSHKECIDFILSDLDYAIANMSATSQKGRANKYVAAAVKSRVALYAGSVARYGQLYNHTIDDVMLCGIPQEEANTYFQMAWDAASLFDGAPYGLASNFADFWEKANTSNENIFIRQYGYPDYVHSFDVIYSPPRMTSTYGDRYNVTLDWVELFDGLPINPATGRIATVDASNRYIVYDGPQALYANAEPRLKASILLPGNTYKTIELDIRKGIIKETVDPSTPITKFVTDNGVATTAYSANTWFAANVLTTTETVYTQVPLTTSTGVKLNKNGLDGPWGTSGGTPTTVTGFHGRKWLDLSLTPSLTKLHYSYQSWVDIRLAEILLNRAEAALELAQNGVASYAGVDMQNDAFVQMNLIRQRAGATLLTSAADLSMDPALARGAGPKSFVTAPTRGLQLLRVERYKELAFEHKLYWDLRRWFNGDATILNYRRRMLNPFLFAKDATINPAGNPVGKYIYDARVCERANGTINFATKFYYFGIPNGELVSNPLLKQNLQW
ncbi:MAG: RagB/SusD family nutrient uptake outer membrane protein [Tenuifilaceae bacterium]